MRKLVMHVVSICLLSQMILAGNLEPSAPPAGTMKPLDQVEPRTPITSVPYTISVSGSYYLTKNLTSTGTAISVNASDVTIDLCGFTLTGPGIGPHRGVVIGSSLNNIEVRNGTIKNFGYSGSIYSGTGLNYRVISVQCLSNTHSAIVLSGNACLVKDCVVYGSAAGYSTDTYGIWVPSNSIVTGNIVYSNGLSTANGNFYSIRAGTGSIVTSNTVSGNGVGHWGVGNVYGIWADTSSKVADNTVTDNAGVGINTGDSTIVSGNTVVSSAGDGILCGDRCTITGNNVSNNGGSGISCFGGYIATNNVMKNNTSAAVGKGGIVVQQHSQIKENTLEGNSKNNIYVAQFRNCIEGNVMSGSDYGINFGSTGNVYLNNRATCNTVNYNLAGNNDGGGNVSF
jgi:hypothetical protein